MKTTKKSMQFGSMLVYCTVYDMCVWGAHINIFSGGPQSSSYGPGYEYEE